MRPNPLLLGLPLGALAVALFAASLPMTRLAVASLDPWFVTAARGALAGLVAVFVLLVLRRPIPWRDLPRLALIALCLVIGFPGLMAVAMRSVPSAHGGVILGLLPIVTALAAVFVAGERPSLLFWAMSLLGAAIVVAFSLRDGAILPVPGDLLLFVSVAICGSGYAFAGTPFAAHARLGGHLLGGRDQPAGAAAADALPLAPRRRERSLAAVGRASLSGAGQPVFRLLAVEQRARDRRGRADRSGPAAAALRDVGACRADPRRARSISG